jgi:hypothetical protein
MSESMTDTQALIDRSYVIVAHGLLAIVFKGLLWPHPNTFLLGKIWFHMKSVTDIKHVKSRP